MRITIELSDQQAERLQRTATSLGIEADELARATIADAIAQPLEDFRQAAEIVLRKNKQLYERLA